MRTQPYAPAPSGSALEVPFERLPFAPLARVLAAHSPLAEDLPALPLLHTAIVPWAKMPP